MSKWVTPDCRWCDLRKVKPGSIYCGPCSPVVARHKAQIKRRQKYVIRDAVLANLGCVECGTKDPRKLRVFGARAGRVRMANGVDCIVADIHSGTVRCYQCAGAQYRNGGWRKKPEGFIGGVQKACTKCGIVKPWDEFADQPPYKTKAARKHSWCRDCQRESARQRQARYRAERKATA